MFRALRLDKYSLLLLLVFGVSDALTDTLRPIFSENLNPLDTGVLTDSDGVGFSDETPKENPFVELFFSSSTDSVVDPPNMNPLETGVLTVSVGAGLEVSVETPKENPLLTGMLTDSVDMEVSGDTPKQNPVVLFFSSSTGSVVVDPPKINPLEIGVLKDSVDVGLSDETPKENPAEAGVFSSSTGSVADVPNLKPEAEDVLDASVALPKEKPPSGFVSSFPEENIIRFYGCMRHQHT